MAFDSVQVRFQKVTNFKSPFANTRVVPFVNSYLEILKSVVDDVTTEYFWFFSKLVEKEGSRIQGVKGSSVCSPINFLCTILESL